MRGTPVTVAVATDYPFRETIALTVTAERATRFPVSLRIPGWAKGATTKVGDGRATPVPPGAMHRIDREWSGTTTVLVRLPMQPLITTRYNGAVAIERGPLVNSLRISERWTRVNADKPHRELPHGDFEVRPGSPWNYGLLVDPQRASKRVRFVERSVGERPFSPEGAGVMATVKARRLPRWTIESGWAGEISAVDSAWADPRRLPTTEPVEEVTLIPYGCTNIRITEFPRVQDTA